ncbi:EAL domain-containing protein [Campylobacter sp. RM16190]|uniref:EAL domain-containing protein n=1 Tax=Campylobacter sp. RM16190 TaxID=1705727 RepID=UPI0014762283|nr:EAL domain-containing protein [Campylobacter sp. RM16190]
MLDSQIKERSRRFISAIEISIPFFALILFFAYVFIKRDEVNLENDEIVLLIVLIICQVYFTTYKIYQSFNETVLDGTTGAFNRSEILKVISKKAYQFENRQDGNIAMLKILNLNDINERYSFDITDVLLKKLIERLDFFLNKEVSKKTLIGRYTNDCFLMFCEGKSSQLIHFLNIFEKSVLSNGIDDIELKIKFELVNINYSKNIENSISVLIEKLSLEENAKFAITDEFEQSVCKSIKDKQFLFQSQLVSSLKDEENLKNILIKIDTEEFGPISKQKAQNIANKNGYEILFDINAIKKFSESKFDDEGSYIIEVSSVSIRNLQFINFIKEFVESGQINPNKVILEFSEKIVYNEMNRFKEILNQYKNLGFRFAFNKFGGNNAGFEYFKHLPIDFFIYDIEFNKNLNDERFESLFVNLNKTAKKIGVKTAVRFVDKADFFEIVRSGGIDYVQGFYIEKPKEI